MHPSSHSLETTSSSNFCFNAKGSECTPRTHSLWAKHNHNRDRNHHGPPSSAISPGTNTSQQAELTRENQEIQQGQLLWPGQCNQLTPSSVQSWSHSPGILPPPPLNFIPSLAFSSLSSCRLPHQTICLVLLALPPKALPRWVVNKTLLLYTASIK